MDKDDTQSTCADCTTTDLTDELPPLEATVCAVNKEKTTKKARRKANKDQADAVWKVCVPTASITATTTRATWSNAISAKRGFIWNVSARTTATSSEFGHVRPAVHCLSWCNNYWADRPCWSRCLFASRNPTGNSLPSWLSNERR